MHALTILQRCVAPLLAGIHRRRLAGLLEAVAATVSGPRLTLTEIGRRFGGGGALRHRIKRADRLLGNTKFQADAKGIYGSLARMLLTGVAEPLIVIDWSDLKEDQSLHLLRASLPVGGRSLTLYEEVHPQRKLGNRLVQHRFLRQLKALMPASADRIIVADSGFPMLDRGALLPRSGASRLALGGAGARTRLRQAQVPLEELQARVRAGHHNTDRARHRRVGAQQSAARRLRAGTQAQAGTPRQDRRGQAPAL